MTGRKLPSHNMHSECEGCRRGSVDSEEHVWIFIAILPLGYEGSYACVLYGIITLQYHDALVVEKSLTYQVFPSPLALDGRQDLGDKADIFAPPKEKVNGLHFLFSPAFARLYNAI